MREIKLIVIKYENKEFSIQFKKFACQKHEGSTYCNLPSAGPAVRTSEMAIDGSPLEK